MRSSRSRTRGNSTIQKAEEHQGTTPTQIAYSEERAQGMDEFPAYSRKTSIATGSLSKQDAVMLPTSSLRKPLLFLVAERFTSGAETECEKNDVIAITTHALGIGNDAR
jgi:hypothetical protein